MEGQSEHQSVISSDDIASIPEVMCPPSSEETCTCVPTSSEQGLSPESCTCNKSTGEEGPIDESYEFTDSSNLVDDVKKINLHKNTRFVCPGEKKPKLRTSKDVYDRLKWDAGSVFIKGLGTNQRENETESGESLDLASVYVGYKDRFLGICELQFEEFEPGGEIPFHRVYYFRTGGPPIHPFIGDDGEIKVREDNLPEGAVFIWDRDTRTDLVFKSGNTSYLKDL